jgi:hypothetical protein
MRYSELATPPFIGNELVPTVKPESDRLAPILGEFTEESD